LPIVRRRARRDNAAIQAIRPPACNLSRHGARTISAQAEREIEMCRRLMLVFLYGALTAGCASSNPDADWNVEALSQLRPAQACSASLPFFGHYYHAGERNAGSFFQPADGRIALRNDGGWCAIRHRFAWLGLVMAPRMTLEVPPRHGEVVLGALDGDLRLAYRPHPGYAGPDEFVVRLHSPIPETIPVRVIVQP
jgi:hypothetical protein